MFQELRYWDKRVEVEKINKKIGINVKAEKIADLLSIMCLQSVVDDDNKHIKVTIPPTRAGKQEPRTNCVSTTTKNIIIITNIGIN